MSFTFEIIDAFLLDQYKNIMIYCQTRRLVKEINIAFPQDKNWNVFDSNFDSNAYERLGREINVDVHSDWRQKEGDNQG